MTGLEIATDTVTNATNIFSLAMKNSGLVTTLATRFFYDLDLRWLNTIFQGNYPPSLSINYIAIKQSFGKIAPTVVLDKDENLL